MNALRVFKPDIANGEIYALRSGIALIKINTSWIAFKNTCSHAGCTFSEDGEIVGETLICNCHGAEFDVHTGAVLKGPAEEALKLFIVQVVEDELEVLC
jgi:Rieske Fe-S protein